MSQVAKNTENIRSVAEVREELEENGISISEWARATGYSPALVSQVLSGRLKCRRGQAHRIAVELGLKPGRTGKLSDLSFWKKGGKTDSSE